MDYHKTSFEAQEEFLRSLYSLVRRSLKNINNVQGVQPHCQQLQKLRVNRYSNCNNKTAQETFVQGKLYFIFTKTFLNEVNLNRLINSTHIMDKKKFPG